MRVMAIDIGTNSTLHLVADVSGSVVDVLDRGITGNSLGAEIGSDGNIGPELLEKNRRILEALVQKSIEFDCRRIGAVGTHALRRSTNPDDFLNMARDTGVPLEIISDSEEARLTWSGVFGKEGPSVTTGLLDLGGGSCELILGEVAEPEWSDSVALGAVALARSHFHNDPPSPEDVKNGRKAAGKAFSSWGGLAGRDFNLVGVAGTITALAAIRHNIAGYNHGVLEGLRLSSDDIIDAELLILPLNLEQRRAVPGMPPARAESIHAGVLILKVILEIIGKSELTVSEKGVLFGLAQKLAGETNINW